MGLYLDIEMEQKLVLKMDIMLGPEMESMLELEMELLLVPEMEQLLENQYSKHHCKNQYKCIMMENHNILQI